MKALTICEPYSRLILIGDKPVENRTWPTSYRGDLLIHAGRSRIWLEAGEEEEFERAGDPLVFGAIVGIAKLAECVRVEDIDAGKLDRLYPGVRSRAHCGGPWCWVLTDVGRYVTPIPWRGAQGVFDVPASAIEGAKFR